MADARPDWLPGALAAQDAYQDDYPPPEGEPRARITVRPQMEVAPPKSFEDYLGEATQPREADTLQRPPVFGLTNRYVDPNDPTTQAGAQRLSNYYGLPGRLLTGDRRNVIQPEVPGQWSDRDEARAALQAGNMTLGGMGMGVDATTGAMPRGFAGTANTLGVGGGRPPRMGAVVEPREPIRRMVAWRDPSGRPTRTAPLPIGTERKILEKGADLAENPPLYHVAGPDYQAGDPLRSLYSRKGNEAYDVFAQRWPDAGDLALHHPHNTYFYKTPAEAATHVENFGGGTVLRVDPRQVEGLRFDPTEAPGYLATRHDVPPEALTPHEQPPLMQAAERKGPMGSVADLTTSRMASPEEINRAAAASRQGITQPELRALYAELGLTGREPSELVKPSLAATHPEAARQAAIDLKLADRAMLNTLTKEQRQAYRVTGKLPGSQLLPSQEAAAPGLAAFEPVKKEVGRAEKAFDTAALRGVKPSLFNLSPDVLRATPADVAQFALPRVAPEMTERLSSVPRGGMARLERAAAAAPVENWGWYNLMQQRDLLHKLHGPEKGEQAFQAWVGSTAGTSMVNPIDNNIRSSTWYLQQILQGKPLPEVLHIADPVTGKTVRTMVGGPPPGYGAKSQIQHADRVKEYLTHSYDPVSNPKPISYYMNLSGNWVPRTVDTHDIRNMVGMPLALEKFGAEESSLLPKEYSYLEGVGQRAATRAGSAQAPHQAATWSGGGEYTGLKSYPAPLQEVINRRAHVTAAVRGITPQQALHDAFTGKAPLLGLGGMALGGAAMGGLADQSQYAQ